MIKYGILHKKKDPVKIIILFLKQKEMIGYEVAITITLLFLVVILINSMKKCSLDKESIPTKSIIKYQEPKYEIISQDNRPSPAKLVWDNGQTLRPIEIPIYSPEDYYNDYYGDYYQGAKEKFEDELTGYNKLDEVLYNNQIDVLLKSTSQIFQDHQINYLEDELKQLENRI